MTFSERSHPPTRSTLRWVEKCLGPGSKVTMVRPVTGGSTHANHALVVETRRGTDHRLMLRRWVGPRSASQQSRYSPEREIAALSLLAGCEIPTPTLVAADPGGTCCDAPALLTTRLLGHSPRPAPDDLPEYLIQFAAALRSVHALPGGSTMPPYEPYTRPGRRFPPPAATRPGLWEHAIEAVETAESAEATHPPAASFIHRDYHPDNTLWVGGRLTGIVDWTAASYGSPAVDVAHMRWNLATRYRPTVADRFLNAYDQVMGGYEHDPYWDLRCVVDLLDGSHPLTGPDVDALEDYLMGVLDRMGSPAR